MSLVHERETDRYRPHFAAFKRKAATWSLVDSPWLGIGWLLEEYSDSNLSQFHPAIRLCALDFFDVIVDKDFFQSFLNL